MELIKMIRPPNAFMVSAMVIAGIWFAEPLYTWWKYLLAAIVPIAYIGIAMVHNDIVDLEIDQINEPDRPLPSGRVSLFQAKSYSLVLFIIGTAAGISLGWAAITIMLLTLVLSLLYNLYLKKMGFIGNIAVGITATSAFLYGDAVVSGWAHFWPPSVWGPAGYLFLISAILNTSREVSKGIMDVEGDKEHGVRTIAVVYGKKKAAYLVVILLGLAIICAILPLINGTFGYLFIVAAVAFLALILRTGIPMVKYPTYENAKKFKNQLLPNMFLALVLVILDVLVKKYTSLY